MNNKLIIMSVVVIGLGIGLAWSFQSNKDHGHTSHSHGNTHEIKQVMLSEVNKIDLDAAVLAYFEMHKALSKDDLTQAKAAAKKIALHLKKITMDDQDVKVKLLWKKQSQMLLEASIVINNSDGIEAVREIFEHVSMSIEILIAYFGVPKGQHIGKYHCPMASNNEGASWLQNSEGTQNPYFGSQMFHCGGKIETL